VSTRLTVQRLSVQTPLDAPASFNNALEVFKNDMRYINSRFTYLLTYMYELAGWNAIPRGWLGKQMDNMMTEHRIS